MCGVSRGAPHYEDFFFSGRAGCSWQQAGTSSRQIADKLKSQDSRHKSRVMSTNGPDSRPASSVLSVRRTGPHGHGTTLLHTCSPSLSRPTHARRHARSGDTSVAHAVCVSPSASVSSGASASVSSGGGRGYERREAVSRRETTPRDHPFLDSLELGRPCHSIARRAHRAGARPASRRLPRCTRQRRPVRRRCY